jgi:hypothetical protein
MSKSLNAFMTAWIAVPLFALATGCNRPVDDATLTTNVKSALASDSNISQQPVQVAVQSGVVTLTGNLSDETASSLAAQDAAKVHGVKEVVNDLTVAGLAVPPTIISPAAPSVPRVATAQERAAIQQNQPLPPPPDNAPPAPSYREVTVQAGYDLPVRITESLDSETTQPGTPFSGVVTHNIVVDGYVAIPAGASVRGTVADSKDATHFKGSSLLSLQLNSIRRHGDTITVSADPYVLQGKGRGANTAEKVGGGAVVGAVLGGIFGGGKGAAIGAGAGAGGGAAIQGFTRGQQVHISSESVIRFRLENPITVRTAEVAGDAAPEGLQQHP